MLNPGPYYLRFNALGTVVTSPFVVTVLDTADQLGLQFDARALRAQIGQTLADASGSAIRILAQIDSTRGMVLRRDPSLPADDSSTLPASLMAAPNVPITISIVDSPLDSDAELVAGTAHAVTGADGVATFPALAFKRGINGTYVLLVSSPGVTCNRTLHSFAVILTNPVASIDISINGDDGFNEAARTAAATTEALSGESACRNTGSDKSATPSSFLGASATSPIRYDTAEPPKLSIRGCLRGLPADAPQPVRVRAVVYLDRDDGDVPGAIRSASKAAAPCSEWKKEAQGNASALMCRSSYLLPTTPSVPLSRPTKALGHKEAANGSNCVSWDDLRINGVKSVDVAIVLQYEGVSSPPIHISVLSAEDAHPFEVEGLEHLVPVPFALALGPLLANEVAFGPEMRVLAALTSIGTLAGFWFIGASAFITQLGEIAGFYEGRDVSFVAALQGGFLLALAGVSAAVVGSLCLTVASIARRRSGWVVCKCCNRGSETQSQRADTAWNGSALGNAQRPPVHPEPLPSSFPMRAAGDAFRAGSLFASHAAVKHDAYLRYVATRGPRVCAPLLRAGEQQLSPHLIEVLAHVFQRYSHTTFAHGSPVLVAVADAEQRVALPGGFWAAEATLPGSRTCASAAAALAAGAPAGLAALAAGSTVSRRTSATASAGVVRAAGIPAVRLMRAAPPADLVEMRQAVQACGGCCHGRCGLACWSCRRIVRKAARACCSGCSMVAGCLCRACRGSSTPAAVSHDAGLVGPMTARMTRDGVLRLKAHLLRVHTGRTLADSDAKERSGAAADSGSASGSAPKIGASSGVVDATAPELLSLDEFAAMLTHRLRRAGPVQVLADLRRCLLDVTSTAAFGSQVGLHLAAAPGLLRASSSTFGTSSAAALLGSILPATRTSSGARSSAFAHHALTPQRIAELLSASEGLFERSAPAPSTDDAGTVTSAAPRSTGMQPLRFTADGLLLIAAAHRELTTRRLPAALSENPSLRGAPAFLAVLDPPLARMWTRLFGNTSAGRSAEPLPSLFDYLSAYHERLLASCCAIETTTAADAATSPRRRTSTLPFPLPRHSELDDDGSFRLHGEPHSSGPRPQTVASPLVEDRSVWQELDSWGFDHRLRHRIADANDGLAPPVYRVLAAAFAHASGAAGEDDAGHHGDHSPHNSSASDVATADKPTALLTWSELSAFRESIGLPPVRRDWFDSVARVGADADDEDDNSTASAAGAVAHDGTFLSVAVASGSAVDGAGGAVELVVVTRNPLSSASGSINGGAVSIVPAPPATTARAGVAGGFAKTPAATTPVAVADEGDATPTVDAAAADGGVASAGDLGTLPGADGAALATTAFLPLRVSRIHGASSGVLDSAAAAVAVAASSARGGGGQWSRPESPPSATIRTITPAVAVASPQRHNEANELRLGPAGYAALSVLVYGGAEGAAAHIRALLRDLGYTDRLLWVGPEVAHFAATHSGASAELFVATELCEAYAKSLVARFKAAGATAAATASAGQTCCRKRWPQADAAGAAGNTPKHASSSVSPPMMLAPVVAAAVPSARARLEAPVFLPQRLLVAAGLTLAMLLVLGLVACALTDRLDALVTTTVVKLETMRATLLESVDSELAAAASAGTQAFTLGIIGATGFSQAAPASVVTTAVTPQSIAALISGKGSASVLTNEVVATPFADASAGVTQDLYLRLALSASLNLAGTLPVGAASGIAGQDAVTSAAQQALADAIEQVTHPTPSSAEALLERIAPTTSAFLLSALSATQPESWKPMVQALQRSFSGANITAVVIATALVLACWALIIRDYTARARRIRYGVYSFMSRRAEAGAASRFVGAQATLSALAFAVTYAIVWLLYMALSIPGAPDLLLRTCRSYLLGLLSIWLVVRVLEAILMGVCLARGDSIRLRRLYAFADLWFSFAGMVTALLVAVARFLALLPFAGAVIMRADMSPLPVAWEGWDPAKASYNALLLQSASQFGNPIAYAFGLAMIDVMKRRRAREAAAAQAAQRAEAEAARATAAAVAATEGAAPLHYAELDDADAAGSDLTSSLIHSGSRAVAAAAAPTFSAADAEAGAAVASATGSSSDADRPSRERTDPLRRLRARNRWHLAVLLAFNPSLRPLRVREMAIRERHGHGSSSSGSGAACRLGSAGRGSAHASLLAPRSGSLATAGGGVSGRRLYTPADAPGHADHGIDPVETGMLVVAAAVGL